MIQIRGRSISKMECHEISGISGLKALTKRECRLGLVHGLKAYEGTHHNA